MEKLLQQPKKQHWWERNQVLAAMIVTVTINLVVLIIGYFVTVGNRINELDVRLTRVETHVEHMREDISEMKDSLREIDRKVDLVLARLDRHGGSAPAD